MLLNICVCAMLIIKPKDKRRPKTRKRTSSKQSSEITTIDYTLAKPQKSSLQLAVTLFRNVHFILLLINNSVFYFGIAVIFTHLMAFAESRGVSPALRSLLISLLGLSSLTGRLALGLLGQHHKVNTIILYIIAVFSTGK